MPYIDVMLVLLIIFMATAPLMMQGVEVDLPKTLSEPIKTPRDEPLIVSINVNKQLFVNLGADPNSPVEVEALKKRVAVILKEKPKTPVYVWGDQAVAYGEVVSLMSLLQGVGVENVGLVTEPHSAPKNRR